jgi:hypothetical protein
MPATTMKMVGFLPRRADFTRPAFREYYEQRHAPLALRHVRVFAKYVRNHLADPVDEPGFDTVSEFWYDDIQAAAGIGAWLATPEGQVLRHDEAQFMDRAHIGSCVVTEHSLHGPPRGFEPAPLRKQVAIFTSREPLPVQTLETLTTWCRTFAQRHADTLMRVALDVPTTPLPEHLAVRALLWLWPRGPRFALDGAAPTPPVPATWLALDAIETEPEALRD